MTLPAPELNIFLVFYATYLMYENHLAEKILLTITGTLLISVRDRQEHGQDVYTAICKHFHWPSLNKKKKSSKAQFRSANSQSEAICPSIRRV